MKHVIFPSVAEKVVMMSCVLGRNEASYLKKTVIPTMRPLSDDEYLYGPAAILRTPAKYSQVLDATDVYWCVDWAPGLLVIRFSTDGSMAWAAMRSPNPEYGGRKATKKEIANYDEFADDPQYNLVYHAWDAEFEDDLAGWKKCTKEEIAVHDSAFKHVNALHQKVVEECRPLQSFDKYFKRCEKSPIWQGKMAMG